MYISIVPHPGIVFWLHLPCTHPVVPALKIQTYTLSKQIFKEQEMVFGIDGELKPCKSVHMKQSGDSE